MAWLIYSMLHRLTDEHGRITMQAQQDTDRGKRIAIMAIKENVPKHIELEILNLISEGYTLNDLKKAGYANYLS